MLHHELNLIRSLMKIDWLKSRKVESHLLKCKKSFAII